MTEPQQILEKLEDFLQENGYVFTRWWDRSTLRVNLILRDFDEPDVPKFLEPHMPSHHETERAFDKGNNNYQSYFAERVYRALNNWFVQSGKTAHIPEPDWDTAESMEELENLNAGYYESRLKVWKNTPEVQEVMKIIDEWEGVCE